MPTPLESLSSISERRAFVGLFVVYCIFIIYGSFIPFRFNLDPNFITWRWQVFLFDSLRAGLKQFSTPDIVSNILLFCPFGFLLIGAYRSRRCEKSSSAMCLTIGALGFLFGFIIESGQTLAPSRSPSMLDALCNGGGALLGAIIGFNSIRPDRRLPRALLLDIIRHRPSIVVVGILLFAAFADAVYPFDVTLDVSAVWANVKQSHWMPFREASLLRLTDLVLEKALLFAAIGFLLRDNLESIDFSTAAGIAWAAATVAAIFLESAKLFFVGPVISIENIVFRSAGALLGIIALPKLTCIGVVRNNPQRALLACFIALLVYVELRPSDSIYGMELDSKISRIEWLPFASYYSAAPQEAFFDLAKKFYLSVPLGYLIGAQLISMNKRWWRRGAIFIATLIVAVLEAAQILVRSRTPSITDVLIFSLGSWMGIKALETYRQITGHDSHETWADKT